MKACIPFVALLFSLNAVSSAFGQCDPLLEGTSPAFEFTIPKGVTVTSVVVKVNNYTNGGNHYSARIRSFQDLETVRVSKSGWYQVLLDTIVGPSVQDLQIGSGIDDFCGYVGDSVRFDWQVVITAEGTEGTPINYSGPLTDNLAGADDLGEVFSGDNLVSGSIDLELTGNGVALYPDMDYDGFGDAFADPVLACSEYCPYATSTNNLDCDDTDQSINPDQTEIPNNSIDEDCSGSDLVTEQLFVEVSVPFEQVSAGSSAWADYDNDGDMDVLITGLGTSGRMATLYQNNQGTFTEVPQTPFEPVFHSDVAWADYDSDGDLDVLIAGNDNNSATITKLYQNDGGNFTEVTFASLLGVSHCDVAWEDYDNDGDPDITMIGFSDQENRTAKLYENQAGVFVEVSNTPFHPNHNGAVAWADYNSDGRPDLFITDYSTSEASRLYENLPEGFAPVSGVPFLPLSFSSAAWADYDQDGDPNLLVAGYTTTQGYVTKLYENQQGTFAELPNTHFTGIDLGAVSWADYDSDGDPDVMISGNNDNNEVTALYRNDGGQFTEVLHTPFPNLSYSDLTWADYDGDGDQDVLITGMNALGRTTKLYENQLNPEVYTLPNQLFDVAEDATVGSEIGTVVAAQTDPQDSLGWQIVSGNVDSAFVVEPHTGTIKLARASLDYETTKRYTLRLTVSNGSYTAKPEAVIINVTDVTEEGPVPVIAWHRVDSVSRSAKLVVDFGEVISGFEQRDVSTVNATTVELTTQDSITFMATVAATTSDSVTVWVPAAVAFDQMGNPTQASEALAITYSSSPVDSTATDSLFTLTVELIALGTKDQVPPVLLSLYQKREGRFESVTVREMSGARLSLEGLAAGEYAFGVYAADTTFLPAYSGNRLMLSLASTVSLYQDTVQQLTLIARPVRRAGTATISGVLRESSEVENGRVAVYQAATDGEVVPHASLYLLDPQTREVVAYTVTDEAGRFSFHGLAAGQYLLAADHRGLPNDDAQNLIQATSNEAVSVTVVAGQTVRVIQVQAPEVITGLDILDQPEINYFPNPTINELIVQTSTDWIGGSLQLRDASGRLMMTQEVTQPLTRLNLVSLPTGVYAASLLKEGQRYTFKVSKQ